MDSNFAKVLDSHRRRVFVDVKRNRTVGYATHLSSASRNAASRRSMLKTSSLKLGKRKKPDVCKATCRSCRQTHHRSLPRYYMNFMRSRAPKRLMYYQNGGWVDHASEVIAIVGKEFELKRAAVEVKLSGDHLIFDFVRMVQFNFRTASEIPIAWIDEVGACFFPDVYTDVDEQHGCFHHEKQKEKSSHPAAQHCVQEMKLEIEIDFSGFGDERVVEYCGESSPVVKRIKVGRVTDVDDNLSDTGANEDVGENIFPEKKPDADVEMAAMNLDADTVTEMFIAGMGKTDGVNLVGIDSTSGSIWQDRLELFLKQVEITRKYRGDANVRYAWLASSGKASSGIMAYGLGHFGYQQLKSTYGTGIHLTACAKTSANYCDVDENGVRYMILCRVILGNMEMVHAGSKQFHPSNENFDSGVDDPKNPQHFVVWSMNINSHIYPEYVVSFKVPTNGSVIKYDEKHEISRANPVHESPFNPTKLGGSVNLVSDHQSNLTCTGSKGTTKITTANRLPKSPWMPFPVLLAAISKKVPSSDMNAVFAHYDQFKNKVMSREHFVRNLRLTVGDTILKTTLMEISTKVPPKNGTSMTAPKQEITD